MGTLSRLPGSYQAYVNKLVTESEGQEMNMSRSKKNRRDFLKESLVMAASGTAIGLAPSFAVSQEVKPTGTMPTDPTGETKELAGTRLEYTYPSGLHYLLEIGRDTLTFTGGGGAAKAPPKPEPQTEGKVQPPSSGVPYRARKVREDLYLVHWIVQGQIHVALLLDFKEHRTICAALMPGKTELWDVAHWEKWEIPPSLKSTLK